MYVCIYVYTDHTYWGLHVAFPSGALYRVFRYTILYYIILNYTNYTKLYP